MTSVLGVSVGASAVRLARHDSESLDSPVFRSQAVTAVLERPANLTAQSIDAVLAETGEIDLVQAVGVAYRNKAQADSLHDAMARLDVDNFRLVPEVTAALEMLETSGDLGDYETLVFYDLGSSGLTVTVVDRATGIVLSTARSEDISGDLVDRLIYDHHVELRRFTPPADAAARRALTARCREAKEQLSTKDAVCMPGEGGLVLLSQDSFDSLIDGAVKSSARLAREVIERSGRTPDAAVLIGGGANIPLVTSVMESWLDLPVIVPAQPELVAAEGAALLAVPAAGEFTDTDTTVIPALTSASDDASRDLGTTEPRQAVRATAPQQRRRRLFLAGGIVVAAAAFGLGVEVLQGPEPDPESTTQQSTDVPPPQQSVQPGSTRTADATVSPEEGRPAVGEQSAGADGSGTRADQPQTQSSVTGGTREDAPVDTPAPPPSPERAPLIPGLPQLELPTLPPPPPIPAPVWPQLPGL